MTCHILLTFFVLITVTTISTKLVMYDLYGVPSSLKMGYPVNISNWTQCVLYCYELSECVAVYDDSCLTFMYGNIKSATYQNGSRFAIKMSVTDDACNSDPYGEATITLNDMLSYDVTITSTTYTFTYGLNCNDNYAMFNRYDNYWCIGVYISLPYNYSSALTQCETMNGTLSGPNTVIERYFILQMSGSTAVLVSGKEKSACTGKLTTAACNGTSGYAYTDTLLLTRSGYVFAADEPDEQYSATYGTQACLVLFPDGLLDDVWCAVSSYGYVIGMMASS